MDKLFFNPNGQLIMEQSSLLELASKYPTPFFVYSQNTIQNNCRKVMETGVDFGLQPFFALKANFNPALLKIIHRSGFGIDAVSAGEIYFALRAGVPADKIVFAGVGKTANEIRYAVENDIHSLNIESFDELLTVERVAKAAQRIARLAVRVNPDVDAKTHPYISTGLQNNKFGVAGDEAIQLFEYARKSEWLKPEGLHVHIGSQITSPQPYLETAEFLINMVARLAEKNIKISFLDLGGGIAIDYQHQLEGNKESTHYFQTVLKPFLAALKSTGLQLLCELGRSIIGDAGLLITRVLYNKNNGTKRFIIVDAGMNNFIRPSLYQAFHQIVPLQRSDSIHSKADVVGPVCESTDFFAKDRELPELNPGDCLAITGAGAYGQVLASNYNLRPVIAEYLVKGSTVRQIRKAETIEEIAAKFDWE